MKIDFGPNTEVLEKFFARLPNLSDLDWSKVAIHDNELKRPAWTAARQIAQMFLSETVQTKLYSHVRNNPRLWANGHASQTALMLVLGATAGIAAWDKLKPDQRTALLSPFKEVISLQQLGLE